MKLYGVPHFIVFICFIRPTTLTAHRPAFKHTHSIPLDDRQESKESKTMMTSSSPAGAAIENDSTSATSTTTASQPIEFSAVTEEAVARAESRIPPTMAPHHSQRDGDEGAHDRIPTWRMRQINKRRKESDDAHLVVTGPRAPRLQSAVRKHRMTEQAKKNVEAFIGMLHEDVPDDKH